MELIFSYLSPLALLFITGLVAGTVDAIAGGGGLISLPMLFCIGVPPHVALGTNKLQSTLGTMAATHSFYRRGLLSFSLLYRGIIFVAIGALLGAYIGQIINADLLKQFIPILLVIILFYTIFKPQLGNSDHPAKISESLFYAIFGFVLGLYDGFFGPGTGSFWIFALTFFLGYNLVKASAYTKVFNLTSNLVATLCFALGQNIDYRIAICMAAGQVIGGRLGAHLAMTKGARIVRPLFILIICGTTISLLYKSYFLSIPPKVSLIK